MGFLKVKTTTRADRISNFQMTTCDFGTPVPDICGTVKISPNVINWKDFYSQEIKTTQKSGKSKTTSYSYKYYVYLELALGEGVNGLGACWVGDTKYASLNAANNTKDAQGFPLTFNSTGNKSSYMSSNYPSLAINYDGLAYLHSPGGKTSGSYLGENSASVPSYAFEVKGQLRSSGDGTDVNPADYILHILKKIGIWSGSGNEEDIVKGIGNFRNYCNAQNLLISSPAETSQRKGQDIIKDLCELFDIYFFWSNNSFKIAIKDHTTAGSWKPNKTVIYDLTPDDMLEQTDGAIVSFSRKDSSEIYNRFTVEFNNRANDYETETISLELPESIKSTGLRQQSTISAPYIYTKNRAIKLAQIASRKNQRERNKYTIRLDWAYAVLEPGDLVTLTDPVIGLEKQIAMVDAVTENRDGTINVELLQYVDGDYEDAIIDIEDDVYNVMDYNIDPSPTARPIIFQPPTPATQSGNPELWIALKGEDDSWGGCNLMIANQDSNYQFMGQFQKTSSYGTLASPLSSNETSFTANINGDFENATNLDALNGNSLFWVNGECMSYETATKNANGTWTFGNLHRGQFYTNQVAHEQGEDVVFCDGSLFCMNLTSAMSGRQLFFKFPSFNVFGTNSEDETDAETYTYKIAAPTSIDSTGVSVRPKVSMSELTGKLEYFIIVDWIPPNSSDYIHSAVYYHTPIDSPSWNFGGYGISTVVLGPLDPGYNYGICICPVDISNGASLPSIAYQYECYLPFSESSIIPPSGFGVTTDSNYNDFVLSWYHASSAFGNPASYYEVSYERNGGQQTIRTSSNECRIPIFWESQQSDLVTFSLTAYYKDGSYSETLYCTFTYDISHITPYRVTKTMTEDGNFYKFEWTPPITNFGNAVDYYELSYDYNGSKETKVINRHETICQVPIYVTEILSNTLIANYSLTTYYTNGSSNSFDSSFNYSIERANLYIKKINIPEDVIEVSWDPFLYVGNSLESYILGYPSEDGDVEMQLPANVCSYEIPTYVAEGETAIRITLSAKFKGATDTIWTDDITTPHLYSTTASDINHFSVDLNDAKDSFVFTWQQDLGDLVYMVDHWEITSPEDEDLNIKIIVPRMESTGEGSFGDIFEFSTPFFYYGDYLNSDDVLFEIKTYYRNGEHHPGYRDTSHFFYNVEPPKVADIYFDGTIFGVVWKNSENPNFSNGIVKPFKNYKLKVPQLDISEDIPYDHPSPFETLALLNYNVSEIVAEFYVVCPNGLEKMIYSEMFSFRPQDLEPVNVTLSLADQETYLLTWDPPEKHERLIRKYVISCNYADIRHEISAGLSAFQFSVPTGVYDKNGDGWNFHAYFVTGGMSSTKLEVPYEITSDSVNVSYSYLNDTHNTLVISWDKPETNQINAIYGYRVSCSSEDGKYSNVFEIAKPDDTEIWLTPDNIVANGYTTNTYYCDYKIYAYLCGSTNSLHLVQIGSVYTNPPSEFQFDVSSDMITFEMVSEGILRVSANNWPEKAHEAQIFCVDGIKENENYGFEDYSASLFSFRREAVVSTTRSGYFYVYVIFKNNYYTAGEISSERYYVLSGAIGTDDIKDRSITTEKIAGSAITYDEIAEKAISTKHLKDKVVTNDKIALRTISNDRIANYAISHDKIGDSAVFTNNLCKEAVTGEKLASVITKDSIVFDGKILQRVYNDDGTYEDAPLMNTIGANLAPGIVYAGGAYDGKTVTFGTPFKSKPTVITIPIYTEVNYTLADVTEHYCYAKDVTTTGFTIVCKQSYEGEIHSSGAYFFVINPDSSLSDFTVS